MHEGWVFIMLFICALGAIATYLFISYKKEAERQTTIRLAVDKGQELTADVVASLVPKKRNSFLTGLNIGMPFVGLGLAFVVFGYGIGEPDAQWGGVFPLFVGLGFIASWYIGRKIV